MATCFRMDLASMIIYDHFNDMHIPFFPNIKYPLKDPLVKCVGVQKKGGSNMIGGHKFSQNRHHGKSPSNPYCWLSRHVFNQKTMGSEVFYGFMLWCFTDWTHTSRVLSLPLGSKWTDFPWVFPWFFQQGLDGLAEGVTFWKHFFARRRKNKHRDTFNINIWYMYKCMIYIYSNIYIYA